MNRSIFLSALFVFFSFAVSAQLLTGQVDDTWINTITHNAVAKHAPGAFPAASPGCALYFTQAGNIRVPYLVYVPASYNPKHAMPAVVFLHGAILTKDSFQYKNPAIAYEPVFSVADTLNTIVIFPFARADFKWSGQSGAYENIITIINQVETNYNVDPRKIYLGGISMGGIATFWFINHKPAVFAGFYTFSALPRVDDGEVIFSNLVQSKPLYSVNAKDDPVFKYTDMETVYEQHKNEAPGWHFTTIEKGGHRFIYGKDGRNHIRSVLGGLLK